MQRNYRFRPRAVAAPSSTFDPAVYGIDALSNKYGVFSTARVLTSWTGNLVRLRRSSDSAESDFTYVPATGWLNTSAIATWAGADTVYVTTFYDQSGNTRDMIQATPGAQPILDISTAKPWAVFDGVNDNMASVPMVGFSRLQGSAAMIAVCQFVTEATARGVMGSTNQFTSQARTGMGKTATAFFNAFGRRLNGDAGQNTPLTIPATTNWIVEQSLWDWSNAKLHLYVDSTSETKDPFQTAGLTSDSDSAAVYIGAQSVSTFFKGAATTWVFTRDLLSGAQALAFASSLASLKPG